MYRDRFGKEGKIMKKLEIVIRPESLENLELLLEEQKAMPWQAVYDEFCVRNAVPVGQDFMKEIDSYEANVTSKR